MNIENRLLPGLSHKLPPVVYVNELQPPTEINVIHLKPPNGKF